MSLYGNTFQCFCGVEYDTVEGLESHIDYMVNEVGESFNDHH